MPDIRPDYTTIQRKHILQRPTALAVRDGECSHGRSATEDEPIFFWGSYVVQEEDGSRSVDLGGGEWHPQQCAADVQ